MNLCSNCQTETPNPKFCSRSCAAKVTNRSRPKRMPEGACKICDKPIKTILTYCSPECKKNRPRPIRIKKSNSQAVMDWRKRVKQRAVELKGGKCVHCGYNRCNRALVFHHLDPTQKDFGIGANGVTTAWNKVVTELEKCVLLCQNCHCEFHDGLWQF